MPLLYITGIPGTGKSTVRQELLKRGLHAVGGAEDNLAAFYDNETGGRVDGWVPAAQRTPQWLSRHTWKIPRSELESLQLTAQDKNIYICAVTANDMNELWDLFETVFALTIDETTLRKRLTARIDNDVGKVPHELESILQKQKTAQVRYEQRGAVIVDATKPIGEVVDDILLQTPLLSL